MNTHHALICIILLVSFLTLYYIHNLSIHGETKTFSSPTSIAYEQLLPLSQDIATEANYNNNNNNNTTPSFFNNNNNNINHPPWLCDCFHYNSPIPLLLRDTPIPQPLPVIDGQDIPLIELNPSITPPDDHIMTIINNNLHSPKTLLLTIAHYGVRHHVYNWIHSLKKTNEDKFVIVCLDPYLYRHLIKAGYQNHAFLLPKQWKHYDYDYIINSSNNTDVEKEIMHDDQRYMFTKTIVIQHILNLDISAFYSDVDVIWNRPRTREYVRTLMDIRVDKTHVVFLQEGFQQQDVNTGFFLMRPTPIMQRLVSDTIYIQQQNDGNQKDEMINMTQQIAFNKALSKLNLHSTTSNIVLLDLFYFPHFDAYFNRRLHEKLDLNPYVIHTNSLVDREKIETLKKNGLWYVDEAWLQSVDQLISV
ncbi:unnamed protein product [Cunninghamella echinulata]